MRTPGSGNSPGGLAPRGQKLIAAGKDLRPEELRENLVNPSADSKLSADPKSTSRVFSPSTDPPRSSHGERVEARRIKNCPWKAKQDQRDKNAKG